MTGSYHPRYLAERLGADQVSVYHGSKQHAERTDVHRNFLTGRCPLVVATGPGPPRGG